MATALASSRGMARLSQRRAALRATRPAPFTAAAVSRAAVKRSQRQLAQECRAAAQDVEAADEPAEPFTLVDLEEFMESEFQNALIERELVDGMAADPDDPQRDVVLAVNEATAVEELFDAAAVENAGGDLVDVYFTSLVEEVTGKDVGEATLIEEVLATSDPQSLDPYSLMSNEDALEARKQVAALKLTREELANDLVPEDWAKTRIDWFTQKKNVDIPLPGYRLNLLWLNQNLAVAVDQVYARGGSAPLTEYYVWPRKDAWEELNVALSMRPWISDSDRVTLLNRLTEVISFWQSTDPGTPQGQVPPAPPAIDEARTLFPDCTFSGSTNAQI